jgi:hypothetical protein
VKHSAPKRLIIVVSLLGAVVLAGCDSSASTSSTTTSVVHRVANPDAVPGDLRLTIFDGLPGTYIEEPVGSASDGPLDLAGTAEAVDDQATVKQEAILEQYGFRSAYQRTWVVKGTGETLIIRVQVMGSPSQARGYYNLLTFAGRISEDMTAFPTSPVADASGFTRSFSASTGSQVAQDLNLVRGRLFYHLIFTGPEGSVSPGSIVSIARSQSEKAASLGYT